MTVISSDFMNETEFENDPYATVEEHAVSKGYSNLNSVIGYYFIAVTILKLVIVLAVIIGNIFLAIVILRFKRLKAVRTNIYILNLSILNIVYYLCSPLFYTVGHIFAQYEIAYTLILQTQMTLLILYMTFAIALTLDWFLSAKKPQLMKKVENHYLFVFLSIYVLLFIEWTISFIYSEEHHIARAGTFLIFYIIYVIVLIILNILKRRMNFRSQSKKTEYALMVTNIIIFSFLPIFVFHLIFSLVVGTVAVAFLFIEIIPAIIEIAHPILIIYILGRNNKYFKMAYNKSFKRSMQSYEDEDLDAISEDDDFRSIVSINNLQNSVNETHEDI